MKKGTIIYFGGYKSPPEANKSNFNKFEIIKEYFSAMNVVRFDQTFNIEKDLDKLDKIIKKADPNSLYFISSSLGVIPALYCYYIFDRPLVAINPSYFPEETLEGIITDDELTACYQLRTENGMMCFSSNKHNSKIGVYVASDDERVKDYQIQHFDSLFSKDIGIIDISETGGHLYTCLPDKLLDIRMTLMKNDIGNEDRFQVDNETYTKEK